MDGSNFGRHQHKEMGRYFGGISYSAVTKIGKRLKERMKQDQRLRSEMRKMNNEFSHTCQK